MWRAAVAKVATGGQVQEKSAFLKGTLHGKPRKVFRRVMLATAGRLFRLRLIGEEHVPMAGPLLVVCNHVSNADPPFLTIAFPRPVFFMGKSELFRIPVLGWLVRRFGGFPVERGTPDRSALRHALQILEQEIAVGIFPEGGRSRTRSLGRALPGAGLLALHSGAPVLPVAIYGTEFFPVDGESPPRRPIETERGVTIILGKPFHVPDRVDDKRVTSEEATWLMMERVAALLPEKYRGVYG
jgi:1-acyl-sn-glycerol-3-phosphate acyltransferase